MTTKLKQELPCLRLCYPNLHNTKILLVAVFILATLNFLIYYANDFVKYRMMEQELKGSVALLSHNTLKWSAIL